MSDTFQIASLSPGLLQPSIAIATSRAGELGVLDFEYVHDSEAGAQAVLKLNDAVRGPFGIKINGDARELSSQLLADLPRYLKTVIFTSAHPQTLGEHVRLFRDKHITTLLEARCLAHARSGEAIGVDGIVAKGHEAGGRVADETTFVLLQRFVAEINLPIWAHGGIGLHTAAACAAAGASGVILDSQLSLTRESPFNTLIRAKVSGMDGSETICLGEQLGEAYRVYFRPGNPAVKHLQELEARLAADSRPSDDVLADWREAMLQRSGWESDHHALFLGQDAAFSASMAKRFRTVAGVLQAIREAIGSHCRAGSKLLPLAPGSPLAVALGTRYPIMQGPMTRVSDVPEFAARVAEEGALPFLALALMRGPEVKALLKEAQSRIGRLPWGVGILGFVPPELRQEQLEVVREYRPPFALIAGGRPDQARELEQQGIPTYLHVPSPGLLHMFIQQGARKFVFEGRECGGHVGPRTSFVLWNQMMDVLLVAPELEAKPHDFHIVFAAGIHDALSAAMVSVIAAPLAERGVCVGVLLGTSYLFTEEAVASGAVLKNFQEQAQQCNHTVLLETGPGHSTRCIDTPYATAFLLEKRRLFTSGIPAEEVRATLENLNLGRLRIASKGVTRNADSDRDPKAPRLVEIDSTHQLDQGMYMIGQVAALRKTVCTIQSLHHAVSVDGSTKLGELEGRSWRLPSNRADEGRADVAIIGMACVLPKASGLQAYWENILNKVDAVGEIPKDRWDSALYFDSDPKAKDKIYSKWGGFLDDVAFDPIQYGMPPSSLHSIEPAQLLTLEVVRAALEDAGYRDRPFPRERTSVILGAGGGAADLGLGYGARSFIPKLEELPEFQGRTGEILESLGDRLPEWTEDSFAGILTNVSAGRVANRFDLGGSNYTVDAACASSLAAVSLALKELEGRTSDLVIAGGVDTMQNPFTYLCFSKTHALSPRGRCRTFDESADGIAISEGVAMMIFKRLEDAERDGDRIYAVIKSAGSSSDGKDRGLTAPRPEGQAVALQRAYARAGFSPATVGLVEAHGTGTVAGDSAEVQALTRVFTEAQAPRQACAIGSVKSMIGHSKCAAGAAGLIKAALALHHKVLPPTLGVQTPNPRARFADSPFFVNTESRPWFESLTDAPRRAGVSAFGFGGTNFHIVMEEYTGDPFFAPPTALREWAQELFLWKGASREALLGAVETWEKALAIEAKPALRDLAYTAWKQAEERVADLDVSTLRLAIVAGSLDDLKAKLVMTRQLLAHRETVSINDPKGIYFSAAPSASQGKLAFLFPGQGSQYPRMLQDLLLHFPEMRQPFEQAARVLSKRLDHSLLDYIFPPPTFTREEERARQKDLTQTNVAQPALGAACLAMSGLLQELGLRPDMLAGHSYGEYVALSVAGVFSSETLIAISEARGRFIVEGASAEPGTMAAVEADPVTVADVCKRFPGVCLANANAPTQNVISGPQHAVEQAAKHFADLGITARLIPVACAFHSPLVASAQSRLAEFLSSTEMKDAAIPVYSNTTGALYPKEPAAAAVRLAEHLAKPVEFVWEIEAMYKAGARVFVEVGPRNVLTGLVDQILGDRPKLAVASDQNGRPGLSQLLHLLGQVSAQGYALKLDRLYRDRSNRLLDLATLQRDCGVKPIAPSVWMVNGARAKPLKEAAAVGARRQVANGSVPPPRSTPAPVKISHADGPPAPPLPRSPPLPATIPPSPIISNPVELENAPEVMGHFQQMMVRFLETQKQVMLAYLGADLGENGVSAPVSPLGFPTVFPTVGAPVHPAPGPAEIASTALPVSTRFNVTETRATVVVTEPDHPSVPVSDVSSGPNKEDLTSQLLAIVSDRTGYPAEMLDLHLDLEADLGIDSIKRVEILGTLQQSIAAAGVPVGEGLMETLTGVRTLQGIVERLVEHLRSRSAEIAHIPTGTPARHAGPGREQLTAQLLAIVSERTGYSPEMLDLHLDLEADLGIDSIKRVEILGTLQQSVTATGLHVEEGLMEKLTGIRTLEGIIDRVGEHLRLRSGEDSSSSTPASSTPVSSSLGSPMAAAPAGPDRAQLTAQLLAIVSERTGYPSEMLDLDLDLEADLGIDSIKRVEILGTFQQSSATVGVGDQGLIEKLSGARTLRTIVDRVLEPVEAAPLPPKHVQPEVPEASTENEGSDQAQIRRFTLRAVETPIRGSRAKFAKHRPIVITGAESAVAAALIRDLRQQGYHVAAVYQGRGLEEVDGGGYAAELGSPEAAAALISLINERQGPLSGIVHLSPLLGEAHLTAHNHQSWRTQVLVGVKSLFYMAKAAAQHLRAAAGEGGAFVIAATGMGGAFLTGMPQETASFPDHGAVAGFLKTLALEWPDIRVKSVDLNLSERPENLARHLLEELHVEDQFVEVGYDGLRRLTLQSVDAPLQLEHAPTLSLDSSAVVLITGGARGITALAAGRFAELYRPTLVLAGRSPEPPPVEAGETAGLTARKDLKAALMNQMRVRGVTATPVLVERAYARLAAEREVRGNLTALRRISARVDYHSVDVRDADAFGALIDGIYSAFGRLDGVIHGAGVIEDKLIEDKTPESFDRVFDTKVNSAFVLSRKLRPESLKFLVFFSSVSGRFGNRGQGDYAAANEVLNKLAVCFDRTWPSRVVAMNWGPWDTEGMVSAEVRQQFKKRGVSLISPAAGLARLVEEVAYGGHGEAEIVIGGTAWHAQPENAAPRNCLPLLEKTALSGSTSREDGAVEFVREFDPSYDLYLDDHRLDGQPVIPLAIATELIAEAAAKCWPATQVHAVRDLRNLNGVVLESGPKRLRIVATPHGGTASHPLHIAVEVTAATHPHRVHYRANVDLVDRLPDTPQLKVAPLLEARGFSMEVEELYRKWLFHGPLFQGISRIDRVGPGGMSALLATCPASGWIAGGPTENWLIDPLVFDSALQLLLLWGREHWDMTALPTGFQSFRRFAAPPASEVLCEMRIRSNTSAPTIHADIFFLDAATGSVLAILDDMQGVCSKALNRLANRGVLAAAANQ